MRILFTGGGTLGPVTPLLAVAEELPHIVRGFSLARATLKGRTTQDIELYWIGTRRGPERKLVQEAGIKFSWLFAPKWRRYFDVRNLLVPFQLALATLWAWLSLLKLSFGRSVIVTAGGYVGVPIVWAGWFLRIPTLLHNQDVRWSLANKLVAPFVKKITYVLPGTVPARWKHKAVWTGNPVRAFILSTGRHSERSEESRTHVRGTILVIGGGTGAKRLNEIVVEALPELTKQYTVIHLTGLKKLSFVPRTKLSFDESRYRVLDFVSKEIASLYTAADLVITRAGMGVLSELAALGKPMIIVPIPGSHQEDNARYFEKKKAAIVLDQRKLTGEALTQTVEKLFSELGTMQEMSERTRELSRPDAAKRVAQEIMAVVKAST